MNLGRPIVTNGLCCVVVQERRALPKLLWGFLSLLLPLNVHRRLCVPCRMESAQSKAELAGQAAAKALADADRAKLIAKDVEFKERRDALRGSTHAVHTHKQCRFTLRHRGLYFVSLAFLQHRQTQIMVSHCEHWLVFTLPVVNAHRNLLVLAEMSREMPHT